MCPHPPAGVRRGGYGDAHPHASVWISPSPRWDEVWVPLERGATHGPRSQPPPGERIPGAGGFWRQSQEWDFDDLGAQHRGVILGLICMYSTAPSV